MIGFLPKFYDGELFSSYLMRIYSTGPYIYPKHFLQEILDGKQRFNYLYVNRLKKEFIDLLDEHYGWENIVNHHSLEGWNNLFGQYKGKSPTKSHIRYCPLCVQLMEEKYIQLLPQISQINYCPIHGCKFKESKISLNRERNYLIKPINDFMFQNNGPIEQLDLEDINVKVSKYISDVLKVARNGCLGPRISDYLRMIIPKEYYLNRTGSKTNLNKVKSALDEFYKGFEEYDLSIKHLKRIFAGDSINSFYIILIAFWLGIKPEQLINKKRLPKNNLEKKIIKLKSNGYSERQIASKLGLSKTKVHNTKNSACGKRKRK